MSPVTEDKILPVATTNRIKYRLFALLIVALSLTVMIGSLGLGLELYLHHAYSEASAGQKNMFRFHARRGWDLRPGSYTTISVSAGTKTETYINDLGIRERDLPLIVDKDRSRLSVIGDSLTFSGVLDYGERFTELMLTSLGESWDVVNISVPGYGTGQQLLLVEDLQTAGFDLGDTVLLIFFANDILDNVGLKYYELERNTRKPVFSDDQTSLRISVPAEKPNRGRNPSHKSWYSTLKGPVFLRKILANWGGRYPAVVSALLQAGLKIDLPRTPGLITGWYSPGWEERWKVTRSLLIYAAETVFKDKNLGIVFLPSPLQVEPSLLSVMSSYSERDTRFADFLQDQDRPQRMLRIFCLDHNLPFIDATLALRSAAQDSPVYFLLEGHLNKVGSKVLADVLSAAILKNFARTKGENSSYPPATRPAKIGDILPLPTPG